LTGVRSSPTWRSRVGRRAATDESLAADTGSLDCAFTRAGRIRCRDSGLADLADGSDDRSDGERRLERVAQRMRSDVYALTPNALPAATAFLLLRRACKTLRPWRRSTLG
jgi:hypothetical protein